MRTDSREVYTWRSDWHRMGFHYVAFNLIWAEVGNSVRMAVSTVGNNSLFGLKSRG